jgi:CheY-like chemotaxis protein
VSINRNVGLLRKIGFLAQSRSDLKSDILVIDDCKLQQIIIMHLLAELDLSCTCVDSIAAAFPYVASLNHNKLIISDMELVDGLGINFIKSVQAHHKRNPIPSIAISSNPKYRNVALKSKFSAFLKKPFTKDDLNKVLLNLNLNFQRCARR